MLLVFYLLYATYQNHVRLGGATALQVGLELLLRILIRLGPQLHEPDGEGVAEGLGNDEALLTVPHYGRMRVIPKLQVNF